MGCERMKYYCIGIKGTGMSTLAQILHDLGNEVSGYDDVKDHKFTQDGLEKRNIPIYYDQTHTIDKDTIVTYSVAFKEDHKELKRVKKLGLTVKKYSEIMGDVIDMFETIGVSGTHGKTTTSSLIKHLLENTLGCNYFIGAGDGYADKKNKYFVVESDEFNRHFTDYHPTYAIITNIEAEHLECYKDIDDIRNTFKQFANQTKKLVIANGDNEEIKKVNYNTKVIFYGFKEDNDVVIKNMEYKESGSIFDLYIKNEFFGHFDIPLYGSHMIQNATAAIIMAKELGLEKDTIHNLLETFHNAKRRFAEEKIKDCVIIDDYAHHPTEIKVTLDAVKQKYPNKRLVTIFVPNTYSRLKDFEQEFVNAFQVSDKTYFTEVDSNREKQTDYPGINSKKIIDQIKNGEMISLDTIDKLKDETSSVVCFLGCASVDKLIDSFKNLIK